ncbi:3'(2'),5'-bisphosphate nucleotidase CysQ [Pelagibacteraceae bacterium]|nr:3'(2'),5'-bisphosphate nucleotidase CysQ [Pelagibacteraceae bacterium]
MKIDQKLSNFVNQIAVDAGKEILKIYNKPFASKMKKDKSPVTKADLVANDLICQRLQSINPKIQIISEEGKKKFSKKTNIFWLVDPLDGTKEFIKKNGEFTVNIALIKNCRPIYGVIYLPVKKEIYFTQNKSAYFSIIDHKNSYKSKKKIKVKKRTGINNRVLLLSRSYSRNIELSKKHFKTDKVIFSGSSIKFCLIASGKGNIYPRLGTTMEWDTAAGHAILNAAGGSVTTLDRKVLKYGKKGFKNPSFIAKS